MRKLWHVAAWVAALGIALGIGLTIQRRARFLRAMEYHRNQQWAFETQAEGLIPPGTSMTYTVVPNPMGTGEPGDVILQPTASRSPFVNYLGIHAPGADPTTLGKPERARAAYHRELRAKYRRAAERPWALVEPDPAPPG